MEIAILLHKFMLVFVVKSITKQLLTGIWAISFVGHSDKNAALSLPSPLYLDNNCIILKN